MVALITQGTEAPLAALTCGTSSILGLAKGAGCMVDGASTWDATLAVVSAVLDSVGAMGAIAAMNVLEYREKYSVRFHATNRGQRIADLVSVQRWWHAVSAGAPAVNRAVQVRRCAQRISRVKACLRTWKV